MRSLKHMIELAENLCERGIDVVVIKQQIDTTTPHGRLVFHLLAAIDEFQRELIVEGTREGLEAARARGRRGGAKAKLSPAQAREVRRLFAEDRPPREICELFGISRASLYRYVGTEEERMAQAAT